VLLRLLRLLRLLFVVIGGLGVSIFVVITRLVPGTRIVALPRPVERLADRGDAPGRAERAAASGGARAENIRVVGVVGTGDAVVALGGAAGGDGRAWVGGGGVASVIVTAAEKFCVGVVVVTVVVVAGVLCTGVCEAPGAVRVDALALRKLAEDLVAGGRALGMEESWMAAWRISEHTAHRAECKRRDKSGSKVAADPPASQGRSTRAAETCRNLPGDPRDH
jgi:hypothetical protein